MESIANEIYHAKGLLNARAISWTLHRIRYGRLMSKMYSTNVNPHQGWTCILLEYGFTANCHLREGSPDYNEYLPGTNIRIDTILNQPEINQALKKILGLNENMIIYRRRKTLTDMNGSMVVEVKQLVVRYTPPNEG
jgi:hypothetical protein